MTAFAQEEPLVFHMRADSRDCAVLRQALRKNQAVHVVGNDGRVYVAKVVEAFTNGEVQRIVAEASE